MITCMYDLFWWLGMIADTYYVPLDGILVMITAPASKAGYTFTISNSDLMKRWQFSVSIIVNLLKQCYIITFF